MFFVNFDNKIFVCNFVSLVMILQLLIIPRWRFTLKKLFCFLSGSGIFLPAVALKSFVLVVWNVFQSFRVDHRHLAADKAFL